MRSLLLTLPLLAFGVPAVADDRIVLSGDLTLVSDYRYRGYSLSDQQPALQGGLTATTSGGYYANLWVSTLDEVGQDADGQGATVEADLTLGKGFDLGPWSLDVAVSHYGYPGGQDVSYFEFPISAARTWGDWTATVGAAWAPAQDALADQANSYVYVQSEWAPEAWPVALQASLGYEDGAFADGKVDWSIGLSRAFGPVSLGVAYLGADAPDADEILVGRLSVAF
jgi:uncharacterized protein (TIGR02001 family)